MIRKIFILLLVLGSLCTYAQDPISDTQNSVNVVWTMFGAVLVLFWQAGFCALEVGLLRKKNAVNVLTKNAVTLCLSFIVYFIWGFGLMFGESQGLFGASNFLLRGISGEHWNYTFIFFQSMLAVSTVNIAFGSMGERMKFKAYLFATIVIVGLIYPIFGSWAWGSLLDGNGWLENLSAGPFVDFAGSTVIHTIGGSLALIGAFILGPRKGKFDSKGRARAIPGHNLVFASLGILFLWIGWIGLNAGSTTAGDLSIGRIALVTNLSGAMGGISALVTAWILFKRPDVSTFFNGILAGLVSISAGCNTMTPNMGMVVGLIAGIVVVIGNLAIERGFRLDDPMGVISVHGIAGIWGTLACGLFNAEAILGIAEKSTGLFYDGGSQQLVVQMVGILAALTWAIITGGILFYVLKQTVGLRVKDEEEYIGLDIVEHGIEAYFESK